MSHASTAAPRAAFCFAFALVSAGCANDAPTSPGMEPAAATPAAIYNVVQLGALGGTGGEASDMKGGRIVGYAETSDGRFLAFLWENGSMRSLGALPNSVLPFSRATALNTAVQVVGFSQTDLPDGGSAEHGFLWQNGTMLDLGTLGGRSSRALDINAAGIIVGFAQNAAGNGRAVRWVNGVIQGLGTLGGPTSQALGINDAGVIVGRSQTKTGKFKGFVWRNGNMRALSGLTEALAINTAGQIVGASIAATGFQHATLWRDGQAIDLGVLPGDEESVALDIDDAGRITGFSGTVTGSRTRVFLWEKGKLKNLGNSAGKPNRALGISPAGHLVGSSTENGNQVAVLWRRQ
jgi:probable HAF family extracellular repeat protein